jgi:hypothetical protein
MLAGHPLPVLEGTESADKQDARVAPVGLMLVQSRNHRATSLVEDSGRLRSVGPDDIGA